MRANAVQLLVGEPFRYKDDKLDTAKNIQGRARVFGIQKGNPVAVIVVGENFMTFGSLFRVEIAVSISRCFVFVFALRFRTA